jgi:hypothetical protein
VKDYVKEMGSSTITAKRGRKRYSADVDDDDDGDDDDESYNNLNVVNEL